IGGSARVKPVPPTPNVVRSAPGTSSTGANSVVIGEIPAGGVFSVLAGPSCGTDGRWWWQVNYFGLVGWTAEGEGYNNYWLEPWSDGGAACPGFLPSRLLTGGKGSVTSVPNLPNRVRSGPAFDADTLGLIPVNGVFSVLSGPYCRDNSAWWQVNYYGLVGWTAEGQWNTYWLQPA
ncbi:MAG: SH3 domain-containing protein, partial [Anaerolineae bacterium]|nr:SH3 domain-containing protein [Anaerolineae bacterium]